MNDHEIFRMVEVLILNLVKEANSTFSKGYIRSKLGANRVDLDDAKVQGYLRDWEKGRYIRLIGESDRYLWVSKDKVRWQMNHIKRIFSRMADDLNGKPSSKSGVNSILKVENLSIDNPQVQVILQEWHEDGFVELDRANENEYLKILSPNIRMYVHIAHLFRQKFKEGKVNISTAELLSILEAEKLSLEIAQDYLENWHKKGQIDLKKTDDLYLLILKF